MELHRSAPASEPSVYDRERESPLHRRPRHAVASARRPQGGSNLTGGGTDGNRLLTAQTGAVLIVLLAVIGVTILRIGQLVSVHMFVGVVLIPIVALKLGSTGYRFARYYTSDPSYRKAGPPAPLLRVIAPMVVLSTIAVFLTGVILMIEGPSARGTLSALHKLSFILWIVFTALHVIGHIGEIPGAISRRYEGVLSGLTTEIEAFPGMRRAVPVEESPQWNAHGTGQAGRVLSLAGALVAGVVLALISLTWFGPWLHQLPLIGH
jgi:hypothetical protein